MRRRAAIRRTARIMRGETAVAAAAYDAIRALGTAALHTLEASGMNAAVLDNRQPKWRQQVTDVILPAVEKVYAAGYAAERRAVTAAAEPVSPPPAYVGATSLADARAAAYLAAVENRLVGVSDTVFAQIIAALQEGRDRQFDAYTLPDGTEVPARVGESIPELSRRVSALLDDTQRWRNRATVIARTEVIAANNAGAHSAAAYNAEVLGYSDQQVIKEWLDTPGTRTRETHRDANGQRVMGLHTPFRVGSSLMQQPGDPAGAASEVVQCRCTALYHYPGDPDYDLPLTASAHQEDTMPRPIAAAPVTDPAAACTCCAGVGEHTCGHECYVCDASGTREDQAATTDGLAPGDPIICEGHHGRPDPDPERSHDPDEVSPDAPPENTPTVPDAAPEDPPAGTGSEVANGVLEAFARHIASASSEDAPQILARLQDVFAGLTAADAPTAPSAPVAPPVDAAGPAPEEIPSDGEPFYGILWPENVQSGDGRGIDAGATTWRDLPLSLMVQDAQAPGHDGAVRAGRIDTIERDESTYAVPVIRYSGTWDSSPVAVEAARQVAAGVSRGVSVDGDAVTVELRGSSGQTLDPMVDDFPDDGVVIEVATAARVAGATVCSIPAFHQAYVANGRLEDRTEPEPGWNEDGTPKDNTLDAAPQEPGDEPALVASAWSLTAAAPISVPAAAFQRPEVLDDPQYADGGCPLTVTEDGRVYGHLATWGTCHIGIDGLCQEPPASATNYAYFATGSVLTDEGTYMPVGPLVMETGHASLSLGARPAASHYDNTGTVVADVVMGQDHLGIWFAGLIRPGTTPERVYALRAAGKVSGDWRECGGNLELVAALVVNTPGFPIPRPALAASAGRAQAMVAAGMVRTPHPVETPSTVQEIAAAVIATLDRRNRAAQAASRVNSQRATVRGRRVAAAAARINER